MEDTQKSCESALRELFVKFSKKKSGIRVGVVVEKQKVNERGASSMFPPNRGFGGSAPNVLGCLAAFFKIV